MADYPQYSFYQVANVNTINTGYDWGDIVFNKTRKELTVFGGTQASVEATVYAGGLVRASKSDDGKVLTLVDSTGTSLTFSLRDYPTISDLNTKLVSYYTKTEVNNLLANKADKSDTYTKTEVNTAISNVKVGVNDDNAAGNYISVGAEVDTAGRNITLSVNETNLTTKLDAIDAYKINNKPIKDNPVLTGVDIKLGGTGADQAQTLTTTIQGLKNSISGGTHFIGVTTTKIEDGSTVGTVAIDGTNTTVSKGDIVIYGNLEFIWDGTKWNELGDSAANAEAITNLNNNKADKSEVYTKTEADNEFLAKDDIAPSIKTLNKQVAISVGGEQSTSITIPYATQATNLESKPIFANGSGEYPTKMTITVGGQTSDEFEVPYANRAGEANVASKDEEGRDIAATFANVLSRLNWAHLE